MDGGSGAAVCPLKGGESPADGHFQRASGELDALKGCQESEDDNERDRPRGPAHSVRPLLNSAKFGAPPTMCGILSAPTPSYHHKHLIDGLTALSTSLYF